jgi:uncharacterized protein DUF397
MIKPTEHQWRRARRCANSACVEVAKVESGYLVRGTGDPDRTLFFSDAEWAAFVGGVQDGDFEFD